MSKVVLICGCAYRQNDGKARRDLIERLGRRAVDFVFDLPEGTTVMTGGAAGVDVAANNACQDRGLVNVVVRAPWHKHRKKAGPIRNRAMLDLLPPGSRVVAFWDGKSRGTKDTIDEARKRGFEVEVIRE